MRLDSLRLGCGFRGRRFSAAAVSEPEKVSNYKLYGPIFVIIYTHIHILIYIYIRSPGGSDTSFLRIEAPEAIIDMVFEP